MYSLKSESETRRRRVGTDPAIGRIKRFDAPQVVVVEAEVERADVLLHALDAHRLRNGDQTVVEMPADDHLRRGLPMLGGNVDDRGIAEQGASAERTPGFRSDPALVVKRSQRLLLESRVKLDLIDGGRDPRLGDDPFQMVAIEIRDADRADAPLLPQLDERFPAFDIPVETRPRPMDQVQVEHVAPQLAYADVESAQSFVEAMIGIA